LTPEARAEATRLVRLNPDYQEWVAAVPKKPDGTREDIDRYTFIRASVWADDIKLRKAYQDASKGDEATNPGAGDNKGYADLLIHGYWHYKDIAFSVDGSKLADPDPINAATQIRAFTTDIAKTAGKSDDQRSYALVWLLHMVGDVHQPLHATALFNEELSLQWQMRPDVDLGDRGGNEIIVIPATGQQVKLHNYWDGMFGGYVTVFGAIFDGFVTRKVDGNAGNIQTILAAPATAAAITDPDEWIKESFELAKKYAYADPVLPAKPVVYLTREYETNARRVAERQISLAGARLARVINEALESSN
jgi:hypothetical protein